MIDRELDLYAMSPARAILLQSPGRKPWGNQWKTFIEPRRGGTSWEKANIFSGVSYLQRSYIEVSLF